MGPHDFSSAEKYGELVFLTDGSISPYSIGRLSRLIARGLKDSTDKDYLLVTAHTNVNLLAASILARKHGGFKLLVWGNSGYAVYSLHFDGLIRAHANAAT